MVATTKTGRFQFNFHFSFFPILLKMTTKNTNSRLETHKKIGMVELVSQISVDDGNVVGLDDGRSSAAIRGASNINFFVVVVVCLPISACMFLQLQVINFENYRVEEFNCVVDFQDFLSVVHSTL